MKKLSAIAGLALLLVTGSWSSPAESAVPLIFVVDSYHSGFAWSESWRQGLRQGFGSSYRMENFYMDTKRLPPSEFAKKGDEGWAEIQKAHPALVILGDDNSLKYIGPRLIKTATPVVYLGINANPRIYFNSSDKLDGITGVLERPLFKRSIFYIKDFVPGAKKVLFMFDNSESSQACEDESMGGKSTFDVSGVQTTLKLTNSWEDWQQTVKSAKSKGYDAIILGLSHTLRDKNDKYIDFKKVVQWTSQNAPVPPFAFWEFSVGKDMTIGGLVLNGVDQGTLAAQMARDILEKGVKPGSIFPKVAKDGEFVFSRKQLEKWHIKLPDEIAREAKLVD